VPIEGNSAWLLLLRLAIERLQASRGFPTKMAKPLQRKKLPDGGAAYFEAPEEDMDVTPTRSDDV
jgi:hypothetical protein